MLPRLAKTVFIDSDTDQLARVLSRGKVVGPAGIVTSSPLVVAAPL